MGREHRIIAALQGSAVPVPPALGLCTDDAVNGAPFYVMGFVDGHVVRDRATSPRRRSTPTAAAHASESLVDTMAAIHAVDLDAVGLDDLGKHEGYIARQLKRWYGQWNDQKTRERPGGRRGPRRAAAAHPRAGPGDDRARRLPARQLHGRRRRRRARRARLGDLHARRPARRLGLLQVYWTGPGDEPSAWGGSATTADGFLDRAELVDRYAERSAAATCRSSFYVVVRVLEAGVHPRGRVLPLPRRRARVARSRRARTASAPDRRRRGARRRVPGGAADDRSVRAARASCRRSTRRCWS